MSLTHDDHGAQALMDRKPRGSALDEPMEDAAQAAAAADVPTGRGAARSLEAYLPEDMCMEQLQSKLVLLNYDEEFCRKKKPFRRPLSRAYFAVAAPGSTGEQFHYFTCLSCGVNIPTPKDIDNPNDTLAGLLSGARSLGFAAPSYGPSKLSSGYGKEVCALLDALADVALERRQFAFGRPVYPPDGYAEEAEVDEGAEVTAYGADEYPEHDHEDDDDAADDALLSLAPPPAGISGSTKGAAAAAASLTAGASATAPEAAAPVDRTVLHSDVDPTLWRLELERVAPRLRIAVPADARDWRTHLEEAHSHADTIAGAWPTGSAALGSLAAELSAQLERLSSREDGLNAAHGSLLGQYRGARAQLATTQEEYHMRTEAISERNNELHRLAAALEEVKGQLDAKGASISDSTPLLRIKGAIRDLRSELGDMQVRIGVVSHTLMHLSLRDKQRMMADAQSGTARDAGRARA